MKALTGEGFEVQVDESGVRTLWLQVHTNGSAVYDLAEIMPAVQERIESGKMPAGVLAKEVGRVVMHTEQLQGALSTLFKTYGRMVGDVKKASGPRVSTAYKARFALLDGMKNKMLKEYARDYIPDEVDNFILTDSGDREALIHRLCTVLVEDVEGGEGETVAE